MEGFDPAVDGHYDVADQLTRPVLARADEHFATTRRRKRSIDMRSEFEARRDRVRAAFLGQLGGLPERPDDLSVETVGVDRRDGYAVERLAFESHPSHRVTANCYVPDGDGPHPGVLFCCGHVTDRKATR